MKTPPSAPAGRLPLIFILGVLMLDGMGFGLVMPVMPELLREVMDSSLAAAALWGGVLASAFAVMQFLFAPMVGALSDRYGRRPVLLVSVAVVAADYLVMGIAWTVWLLLAARIVSGIAASTEATAGAFVADVSRDEARAGNFGLMNAALGLGLVLGPAVGGLLGGLGTRAPFFAAAALAAVAFGLGLKVMPETLTKRRRRALRLAAANPLGALRDLGTLPGLGRLFAFQFVYEFAFMVYPAVWAFFTTARFGWGPEMIGLSLALYGIGFAVVQGLLVRPALRFLGERRTVLWGLLLDVGLLVLVGSLTDATVLLVLTPLAALGAVVLPAVQAMMSRRAGDRRQGSLQGVMASVRAVAAIGAPVAMTGVFSWFTEDDTALYLPGAPFYLAAALVLGCVLILVTTPRAEA